MGVQNAEFPSSAAFDQIQEALNDDTTRKDAIKNGKAIFAFTLKNKKGATESWHIDLKQSGAVGKGVGNKPTCTLSLSDEDFQKLIDGKANAQSMFMSGKLKIKGNVMASQRLTPILNKASSPKAKL